MKHNSLALPASGQAKRYLRWESRTALQCGFFIATAQQFNVDKYGKARENGKKGKKIMLLQFLHA